MKYYDEITASELKCRPIVNQTGTTFGTAKVIYEYSNPIETINYIIHKIYGRKLVKLIFKKKTTHIQVLIVQIHNRLYNPIKYGPHWVVLYQ